MIDQQHATGQGIRNLVENSLNWWCDLPEEYKDNDPFRVHAGAADTQDSVAFVAGDPRTQSVHLVGRGFQEVFRHQLMQIVLQPSPGITFGSEYGGNPDSHITKEYAHPGAPIGAQILGPDSSAGPVARDTGNSDVRQPSLSSGVRLHPDPEPVVELLERSRNQIEVLHKKVDSLLDKVQVLEEMVIKSHQVLQALSQSYYWTPEWQAKENRADEDARLGRSQRYESADELIADLNQ